MTTRVILLVESLMSGCDITAKCIVRVCLPQIFNHQIYWSDILVLTNQIQQYLSLAKKNILLKMLQLLTI